MIDLQTFAVMNLSSALDLIIDTLQQPDINTEDGACWRGRFVHLWSLHGGEE